MIYSVAYGKVDTKGREQLLAMAAQWDQAGKNTNDFSLQKLTKNLKFASDIVNSMSGKVLTDNNNKPIIENGSVVKTFQATEAQKKNPSLFGYSLTTAGLKAKDDPKSYGSSGTANKTSQNAVKRENEVLVDGLERASKGIIPVYPELELVGSGKLVKDTAKIILEKQALKKAEQEVIKKQAIENNFNTENPSFGNSAVRDFQPGTTHKAENINTGQVTDRDGLVRVDEKLVGKNPKTLNDQQVNSGRYPTGYPAWKPGTTVTDRVVTEPEKMRMVIDSDQYQRLKDLDRQGKKPAQALGGWATNEPVNSVADMRNKLAVTEEFKPTINQSGKPNKFYVVEFEVQPGVGVREGKAGSMYDYETGKTLPGNAQQMNFVDKSPYTNPELFKFDLNKNIKEIK